MSEQQNLVKLVLLVDVELDRTMNVPEALRQLQIIRSRMVKAEVDPKCLFDLTQVMATMQPYLIEPNFMERNEDG